MSGMRSTVNRVLLALAGLLLTAVGGAVLAVGLGASLPS
ncbi:alkaline shock response membrane anchor protein AmaP, partial [Streptomyces sp. SID8455]|nr:alkaline shock response membrane anchor protein AmaP [Streptomyces sp. SID8455]